MNPHRELTIRLMIATAFLMLITLVGALASLGGDDTAAAWGKALLSAPIFAALFVFLYVVWKADLPRLWREFTEALERESGKTIKRRSDKAERQRSERAINRRSERAEQQRHEQREAGEGEEAARSTASAASYWVRLGASRQQRMTADEMAEALERLAPLAAQAEASQRAAERADEALRQAQAQQRQSMEQAQAATIQQAEALAAEWTTELVTRWYEVLFPESEVPAPELAFAQIRQEAERLREVEQQAASQATRLAELAQSLQARTDELAASQQQVNTLRARLSAVREVLALTAEVPLIEGTRQLVQEQGTLRREVERELAARRALEQQLAQLEAQLAPLSRLQEVSAAELAAFWPTVNYGSETIPERWPRRIEQRFRAVEFFIMRPRTGRTELMLGEGGETPLSPTPASDEAALPDTNEAGEGEEGQDASSASSDSSRQFGQFGVRKEQPAPVRPGRRFRRPSMGHY